MAQNQGNQGGRGGSSDDQRGGNQGGNQGSSNRGFASMDDEQQRRIAQKGGETSAREQDRDDQGQFTGTGRGGQNRGGGQGGSNQGGNQGSNR